MEIVGLICIKNVGWQLKTACYLSNCGRLGIASLNLYARSTITFAYRGQCILGGDRVGASWEKFDPS
jgi:hypothetical protein